MQSKLDQSITKAAASEATYSADQANLKTIQDTIASATTPLEGAQSQLAADGAILKRDLLALAQTATEAANAISGDPAPADPNPNV